MNPVIDFARELGVGKWCSCPSLAPSGFRLCRTDGSSNSSWGLGPAAHLLAGELLHAELEQTHQNEIRDEAVIAVPAGQGKTSFIDARDVAAVAAKVLADPRPMNRWHDLTGSEALGYGQVAEILTDVLGRPIAYANPSLRTFFQRMRAAGTRLGFRARDIDDLHDGAARDGRSRHTRDGRIVRTAADQHAAVRCRLCGMLDVTTGTGSSSANGSRVGIPRDW